MAVSKVTGSFEADRVEVANARGELTAMRAKVRSLEDQLLASLAQQVNELSVALGNVREIGAILADLRALRK
jgi:hypothetical protein